MTASHQNQEPSAASLQHRVTARFGVLPDFFPAAAGPEPLLDPDQAGPGRAR